MTRIAERGGVEPPRLFSSPRFKLGPVAHRMASPKSASTIIQVPVSRRQGMMIGAQQSQVFFFVVSPIAIDVIDLYRYQKRQGMHFTPTTHSTPTREFIE